MVLPHEASTDTGRASAGAVEEIEIPSWKPPAAESAGSDCEEAPFFISVVGQRRVRRLHKNKGCPTSASELREVIPLWTLAGEELFFNSFL
jgi:hypothetical protein